MNCWIGLKIILMSNYFKPLVFANGKMGQAPIFGYPLLYRCQQAPV